jgi:hypothetical protein
MWEKGKEVFHWNKHAYKLKSNEKQGPIPNEKSQTLLTNKKQGSLD